MAFRLLRVTTTLGDASGLSKDRYVNSWHVQHDDAGAALDLSGASDAFETFYKSMSAYLSPVIDRNLCTTKWYDVATLGSHLPPDYEKKWAIGAAFGVAYAALPNEVALVVTFHGEAQPAPVKRQSYTGRIYLGPLSTKAVSAAVTGTAEPAPDPAFIAQIGTSITTLETALLAAHCQLGILSMKQRVFYPTLKVTVDNAWDTQRSRGNQATTRASTTLAVGVGVITPF